MRDLGENFLAWCDTFGVRLFDWQREAFGEATRREAGRFVYRVAGISVPRGNGKSFGGAVVGRWRLHSAPQPQLILSAALDFEGARVVLDHAKALERLHPDLGRGVEPRADALVIKATGSRWLVRSREHTASRGLHPDLVLYDEIGWARDDELFSSLLAGQASVEDPLMVVVSTVGRRQSGPLWTIKTLAEGGDRSVLWWHTGENRSPRVTRAFLERQRGLLLPAQYAREHENAWVEGADAFASAADVDAAMGHGWTEQVEARPGVRYEHFWDLGAVHDPTVGAVGHAEGTTAYIDRLVTFQGSREEPVRLATVAAAMADLAARFPPQKIRVESWQGLAAVQSLGEIGLPVELFTPTAKSNAEEWPVLAQRLAARTLVVPPHARLREELLNLVVEAGPSGVRVIDRGAVHQDHAVAVRGVVAALASRPRCDWPTCTDVTCSGMHLWLAGEYPTARVREPAGPRPGSLSALIADAVAPEHDEVFGDRALDVVAGLAQGPQEAVAVLVVRGGDVVVLLRHVVAPSSAAVAAQVRAWATEFSVVEIRGDSTARAVLDLLRDAAPVVGEREAAGGSLIEHLRARAVVLYARAGVEAAAGRAERESAWPPLLRALTVAVLAAVARPAGVPA